MQPVYGIVKDHDGAITVSSEVGKGTIFKLYLPVITQSESGKDKVTERLPRGKGCILLIDDEPIINETTSKLLREPGYTVLMTENGREGLELYKTKHKKINLILLDMIMPVMNGYDTFKEVKKVNPNAKILLTSGFAQDAGINELILEGACGFMEKPCRIDDLSRMLKDLA